jgi:hypothetical protein
VSVAATFVAWATAFVQAADSPVIRRRPVREASSSVSVFHAHFKPGVTFLEYRRPASLLP